MDMNSISRWRKQFIAEHGDRVPLGDYWWLFEDGAKLARDSENGHWEAAPEGTVERLRLLLAFYEIKQRIARQRFKDLKLQIEVTFCGRQPDDAVQLFRGSEPEALTALQDARAAVRRADYAKQNVERDLKIAEKGRNWREREAANRAGNAERAAQRNEFAKKISNLKV